MENEIFEFHQIFVVYTHDLYHHKNNFLHLKLKKDNTNGNYYNPQSLSYAELESIKSYCEENELEYYIETKQEKNYFGAIKYKYSLKKVKDSFYYIELNENQKQVYIISSWNYMEYTRCDILDTRNHFHISININLYKDDFLNSLLTELLNNQEELTQRYDEKGIVLLIHILSVLIKEESVEKSLEIKLLSFKNSIKTKIAQEMKDGFLCNNIPGFLATTEFYIKYNRLISSSNGLNQVEFKQEERIWKYLFNNKHLIGKRQVLLPSQIYSGKKIKVFEKNLGEFEMVIKYINKTDDGKLKLKCIKPDGKIYELSTLFTEEELKRLL
ncbi:hypothetical protein [Aliarcobacter butzleri]|uniref:hypothetical protein n=1 Tax=Aliarcobacter butzleri TaxID=28197 RepID=UPI00126049E5|nr:hypothetical protein [Aliarcobacter butzleri]